MRKILPERNGNRQPAELSREAVDQLGKPLVGGCVGTRRFASKEFLDVEHADRTFFIHVSPSSGRVMLLATWERLLRAGFASFEEVTEVM